MNATINVVNSIESILHRFSNFNRLVRSIAYVMRFVKSIRNSIQIKKSNASATLQSISFNSSINLNIDQIQPISVQELESAERKIVYWVQHEHFESEFNSISKNLPFSKASKLHRLNPFIDENGILRVNGRLRNAPIPYNEKYPTILPSTFTSNC